jgi:hypothetical protein
LLVIDSRPNQGRQRTPAHAEEHFELKRAVLSVVEADTEVGLVVATGLDERNTVAVAVDAHVAM